MEASSTQVQYKEKEPRVHRPYAFDKMEGLVREMQDPENGVPVRSQKQFLTSIPAAFMGYDLIEWLMERLNIEESEAVHLANQLCQYGYFFPVNDSRTLSVKDDSSLYRFQTPYYWPWQHRTPDNVEYAIYLAKRTLRNKQRHGLEEYELEALNSLKRNLQNKWDIIQLQAEEQLKLAKDRKKGDKIVSDSQERAFWRVYRPPPGCSSNLEVVPVPTRARPGIPRAPPRKRTLNDVHREVELLRNSLTRTRIKMSVAVENLKTHFETYLKYDPMLSPPAPSNPWITDDQTFWQINSALVENPTEKRVQRWALSMEELMSDPTGLQEFTNYLRKEYSHENIRFYVAVKDLRHSFQAQINEKVTEIFKEFLAPGAPCEINIDGKTMEKTLQEMKTPSRFSFDSAAEHVYTLLLKKDCYPRFIRSDHYRNLLTSGAQPSQKKRFFVFGGQGKKKVSSITTPMPGSLQQQHSAMSAGGRRRGSDRSLSGSAHELAICGVRETTITPRVAHSHSQSNLTDIPYRDVGVSETGIRPMDDICPWDTAGKSSSAPGAASKSRKNSSQLDSCSSSSDASLAVTDASERLKRTCPPVSIQRNFSVGSVGRVKLVETSRASVSTCTFTSPQQSFEELPQPLPLQLSTAPPQQQQPQTARTPSGKAPLISISAIVGDLPEETTADVESQELDEPGDTSSDCALMSEPVTLAQSLPDVDEEAQPQQEDIIQPQQKNETQPQEEVETQPQQKDATQPQEKEEAQPQEGTSQQEQRDNNVNEVCPWEDEENCKVDAPYVKTYATLGYL